MTKSKALPADSKRWGYANSEWTGTPKQTIVYTTFVETDSNGFRELVQKLTGVSEGEKLPVTNSSKGRAEAEAGNKSDGNCCALMKSKSGIEVGPQKSAFKLHQRRQFQKRLEIKPGLYNTIRLAGNTYVPNLIPSPITPLQSTSSPSYCYSSTPPSFNQSSCLEEEGSVKRELPELLPLFPLHSPTQPN